MLYAGVSLIVIGYMMRVWAIWSMRGRFTFTLTMPHGIIRVGPYRWIRHPSYIGTLLMVAGISVFSPLVAVNWLAFMFFLARIKQEELIMSHHPQWEQYKKETGQFFPRIGAVLWRR